MKYDQQKRHIKNVTILELVGSWFSRVNDFNVCTKPENLKFKVSIDQDHMSKKTSFTVCADSTKNNDAWFFLKKHGVGWPGVLPQEKTKCMLQLTLLFFSLSRVLFPSSGSSLNNDTIMWCWKSDSVFLKSFQVFKTIDVCSCKIDGSIMWWAISNILWHLESSGQWQAQTVLRFTS